MTPIEWDGDISYADFMFLNLLGVADRLERVTLASEDAFYRFMCQPAVAEKPMTADEAAKMLLGCIATRGITAERAWALCDALLSRLGDDGSAPVVERLLEAGAQKIHEAMTEQPVLHRYPKEMAKSTHAMAQRLADLYDGDARNVWRRPKSVAVDGKGVVEGEPLDGAALRNRLMGFRGIGIKVATMGCRILLLDLGVAGISDGLHSLLPSPDVHVLRVAERLGLISRGVTPKEAVEQLSRCADRVGRDAISYDGLWVYGREVCFAQSPDCDNCVLRGCGCLYADWRDPRDIPEVRDALSDIR